MTHPIYTAQSLATLSPAAVKVIARQLGITAPAFRKDSCIAQILEFQSNEIAPATPQAKACATCSHFDPHGDGSDKGWCKMFDRAAREGHEETQDCLNQVETEPTEQEAAQAWTSFTVAAQIGDVFQLAGSPKAVVIDRYYRTPNELIFSVVLPDHNGDVMSWVLPMQPADELVEESWYEAQSELTQLLGEQVEAIAPEPVVKVSENVYRVLSSKGDCRYQVDLWKRTCTCPAGAHRNPCRHIPAAEAKQRQETEAQMLNKLPAGWRQKADGWFYNSLGHRTNLMPV